MKVGVLGSGDVAKVLAAGFVKHGHNAAVGSRDPAKLRDWGSQNPQVKLATFSDCARHGELIVLAVKGTVAGQALRLAGAANLDGKVVMDATNPIADGLRCSARLPLGRAAGRGLSDRPER